MQCNLLTTVLNTTNMLDSNRDGKGRGMRGSRGSKDCRGREIVRSKARSRNDLHLAAFLNENSAKSQNLTGILCKSWTWRFKCFHRLVTWMRRKKSELGLVIEQERNSHSFRVLMGRAAPIKIFSCKLNFTQKKKSPHSPKIEFAN